MEALSRGTARDTKGRASMSDVNVSGNPAEVSATPTPSPAPATPGVSAPQLATPAAPAPAATPQEATVPSYRLREVSTAYQDAQRNWAAKEAEFQARLEQTQRQLQALAGVTPQAEDETTVVRSQFAKLYPRLAKMEENADRYEALLEQQGDLNAQNQHYWESYGRQQLNQLFEKASGALGTPLTDQGKRILHAAFSGYVSSSPELAARYTNDPTLIEEFWNMYTSSFIDPVRRSAAATIVARTGGALPQDTPGGAPRATPAPHMSNMDERANAAWAQYAAIAKK